ncbi:MAG: T9SS type A sorting domain-containing protein [Candidatus Eisenbacteria bacterium]|uniref:T9SS type A sorting domain-containing protein n=1 Tax=Eiseniibacteriota bacterium TaxID=2212470 RepID=A0A956NED5_UNCEI|nr:T9SS type A sorting domain-containing protein [Candidatus Eisenbacteria bacterium]
MKRVLPILLGLGALAAVAGNSLAVPTTIQDIQLGLVADHSDVQISNVVVTGVGVFGFFVQTIDPDPTFGRQWSGIWVYTNANNNNVQEGDRVNVSGEYYEYFDFSEIDVTGGGFAVIGQAPVPDPVEVTIAEVNDTGLDSEAYESVLIKVDREDPTLYAFAANSFNEWYVRTENFNGAGSDSLLVDNYSGFDYERPAAGTELEYMQGVLVYNFSQYKLAPRDCIRDIGTSCPPVLSGAYATSNSTIDVEFGVPLDPSTMTDEANYELASFTPVLSATLIEPNVVRLTTDPLTPGSPETVTVIDARSEDLIFGDPFQASSFRSGITPIRMIQEVADPSIDDASPLFNEVVTVEGTVTGVNGSYYYLQDDDGGMWDSIYSRVAKQGAIEVGDKVQVSGRVNEFFGATQLNFLQGINNYQNLGVSATPPVTNLLTAADIPYNAIVTSNAAEPWEFNLVRLESAFLDSNGLGDPAFGEWELLQLPDSAGVDFDDFGLISFEPEPGMEVNVTGILKYEFNQFRMMTRDLLDVSGVGADAPEFGATATQVALGQSSPNPFSTSTEMLLTVPRTAQVTVQVLDVAGRLVRTLVDGEFAAGGHVVQWDGQTDLGTAAPAGTYFYQLVADGQVRSQKAVKLN